jgi:K+-transporting ATPase KdpF subunit
VTGSKETPVKETPMEIWIAGVAAAGLSVYLLYALVRPERF